MPKPRTAGLPRSLGVIKSKIAYHKDQIAFHENEIAYYLSSEENYYHYHPEEKPEVTAAKGGKA